MKVTGKVEQSFEIEDGKIVSYYLEVLRKTFNLPKGAYILADKIYSVEDCRGRDYIEMYRKEIPGDAEAIKHIDDVHRIMKGLK